MQTANQIQAQLEESVDQQPWFYCSILLAFVLGLSQLIQAMETRKKAKLKKLKKLSKECEKLKEVKPTLITSNLRDEEKITMAIDKLGLRAERLPSDMGIKKNDWETQSNVSRQSSQMSTQRHNKMQESVLDHPKVLSQANNPIIRICLTGGPCAGKTTAMNTLNTRLMERGFCVFIVPEAATMLMKGGAFIQTGKMTFSDQVKFQINIMKTQMALEDTFLEAALSCQQKVVILCDRGVMDGMAYTDEHTWQALLDETGWSTIQLRDRRYEAIIHLVTAADGASKYYTGENNEARYETIEEAIELDKKLINSWTGHPHLSIIDNRDKFDEKINRCINSVYKVIGLPTDTTYHKKFLIAMPQGQFDIQTPGKVKKEVFHVVETYLKTNDFNSENLVRKIGKNDSFIYNHEIRQYVGSERIMKKRQIGAREYIEMVEGQKIQGLKELKKFRQCFIHEQQYFMVETLLNCDGQPSFLRIESEKEMDEIQFPVFVKVLRDVTEESSFFGINMARKDWKLNEEDRKEILAKAQKPVQRPQSATKKAAETAATKKEQEQLRLQKQESVGTPTMKAEKVNTPTKKEESPETPKKQTPSVEKDNEEEKRKLNSIEKKSESEKSELN